MTPELQRTMRIAWENTQQQNRHHMESFDLLEALQKTGTSAVWQKIREEGFSDEQIHLNLKNYEKAYFLNKQTKVRKKEFPATKSLKTAHDLEGGSNSMRASMSPALKLFSLLLILGILTFFILAIVRC
jgi:hypothetical protein